MRTETGAPTTRADASAASTPSITKRQLLLVSAVLAALVIDGLDVQLLAFVTPLILREWTLSKSEFAPALAAVLIGMAIGTFVGGWLGDRLGRKRIFALSVVLFGWITALASLSEGVVALTLLRFVSGLGFGAAYPNGVALATEWLPARLRARCVGILSTAAPLGGMLGAALSFALLDDLGWRGMFGVTGVFAAALGIWLLWWLPESRTFLLIMGRRLDAERQSIRMLGSLVPIEATGTAHSGRRNRSGTIFTRELNRLNIGVSLCFFGIAFTSYSIVSWIPTILTSAGLDLSQAIVASFLYNGASIACSLTAAMLLSRQGSRPVLLAACTASLVTICALAALLTIPGLNDHSAWPITVYSSTALLGGAHGSGIATVYAILANGYPEDRRATGVGFGLATGRVGGILAVLVSGSLLSTEGDHPGHLFVVLIVLSAVAGVAALIIDRHVSASATQAI